MCAFFLEINAVCCWLLLPILNMNERFSIFWIIWEKSHQWLSGDLLLPTTTCNSYTSVSRKLRLAVENMFDVVHLWCHKGKSEPIKSAPEDYMCRRWTCHLVLAWSVVFSPQWGASYCRELIHHNWTSRIIHKHHNTWKVFKPDMSYASLLFGRIVVMSCHPKSTVRIISQNRHISGGRAHTSDMPYFRLVKHYNAPSFCWKHRLLHLKVRATGDADFPQRKVFVSGYTIVCKIYSDIYIW